MCLQRRHIIAHFTFGRHLHFHLIILVYRAIQQRLTLICVYYLFTSLLGTEETGYVRFTTLCVEMVE